MLNSTQVEYYHTTDPSFAASVIEEIKQYPTIAADFEVAIKYTPQELEHYKQVLADLASTKHAIIDAKSRLKATALDHPSHCTLTHCSVAISDHQAFVFVLDNPTITSLVLDFLTSTEQTQIWHNLSFDARHIVYHTGKFPKNYEDTQILAKTLLNHTNPLQAKTGLKELAGMWYGDWGISSDNFTREQMYQEHVIRYAAIDACATFKLWTHIQEQCDSIDKEISDADADSCNTY
jgi:hypothetical protein